ncbi:MAG: hypothetical protein HY820_33850, partial [Acidobacteria bacterium]|nr:hypothetical protein [Acidobacteriota bacterium]
FAIALQAAVRDQYGNPRSGATVAFNAPTSGASGSFPGGSAATAVSDSQGIATAPAFTANGVAGGYAVNATTAGVGTPAAFLLTNAPNMISVTVTSNPLGRTVRVDGTSRTTPASFTWEAGSQHTIEAADQPGDTNTRYRFTSWSDGGPPTHTVNPTTATTYTANFQTQYRLTTSVTPAGAGSITAAPSSPDGFYDAGSPVQLTAQPNATYSFSSWSGDAGGGTNPTSLAMTGPRSASANFTLAPVSITVTSNPVGRIVRVDGTSRTTPASFTWEAGSQHTIEAADQPGDANTRYRFTSWSDGGAPTHTVNPTTATTYTANFQTQYRLTTSVIPAGAGSITAVPGSADGFHDAGSTVQLTAQPNATYSFSSWSGDAGGGANPTSLAMTGPRSASANFTLTPGPAYCVGALTQTEYSPPASGGTYVVNVSSTQPCTWTAVSSSPSWAVVGTTTLNSLTFTVLPNTTGALRTATITINAQTPQTITVTQAAVDSTGLRFVPMPPCRILETRSVYAGSSWTGAFGPPRLAAGVTRTLPVTSSPRCNVPGTAKVFVLNVTLDTLENATGPVDFLTIWPTGTARPNFWTARTSTGGYIANGAIVQAGTNGSIDIYSSHDVNLLLDISGYFTDDASAGGLLYYPIGPCRAVDTRGSLYSSFPPPFGNQKLTRGETRTLSLPGSPVATPNCQIPPANAYSLQMTLVPGDLTNGAPVAYLTLWPAGQSQPVISNFNSIFGYALANSGIVPARPDGSICVFAYDPTNLILDVNGYFAPDDGTGRGLYYYPVTQCRVMNTQDPSYPGAFGGPQLTPAEDRTLALPGSPHCPGLPSFAKAWALNATAIPGGAAMPFLSMWPAGANWPNVSQLNAFQGQTVSNSAIVPSSATGAIQIKVNGTTGAAIEVAGYFARP